MKGEKNLEYLNILFLIIAIGILIAALRHEWNKSRKEKEAREALLDLGNQLAEIQIKYMLARGVEVEALEVEIACYFRFCLFRSIHDANRRDADILERMLPYRALLQNPRIMDIFEKGQRI